MGSSFSNLLVAPLAAQPLQVACLELPINRVHRHREFEPAPGVLWFQLQSADATVLVDRIAFMGALSPVSVFKLWCTLRSTHRWPL